MPMLSTNQRCQIPANITCKFSWFDLIRGIFNSGRQLLQNLECQQHLLREPFARNQVRPLRNRHQENGEDLSASSGLPRIQSGAAGQRRQVPQRRL